MAKPRNIVLAVNLLWASMALWLATTVVITFFLGLSGQLGAFGFIIFIFAFALMAFLNFGISRGEKISRNLSTLFFFLGIMAPLLMVLFDNISAGPFVIVGLDIIRPALKGYALFLLFTKPGSEWFVKDSAAL